MKNLKQLYDNGQIATFIEEDDLFYLVQDGEDKVILASQLRDKLRGYRVYSVQISQSGTDAPTIVELENTLGDIIWTRLGTGQYEGVLTDMFPDITKVAIFVTANEIIIGGGGAAGKADIIPQVGDSDSVELFVFNSLTHAAVDNGLGSTTLEIRVYDIPAT